MVGVPGKYKGCNTCRLRRVKCDNQRPFCKKCLDSGRECAGYERETVFIVGTLEDRGRCSSHPPRVVGSSKKGKKGSSTDEGSSRSFTLAPLEPLPPAWNDLITLSASGTVHQVQLAALSTNLVSLGRSESTGVLNEFNFTSFPPYSPVNTRPAMNEAEFQLGSQCILHLAPTSGNQISGTSGTESICMFLYEHNSSNMFIDTPFWKDDSQGRTNMIRHMGPDHFKNFPNHHFFSRVYRPTAICAAVLNRTNTFLAGPEWTTVPWENHPKPNFDKLLDIICLVPSVLSRADRIIPYDPTMERRLMAQDLLANCLSIERLFDGWQSSLGSGSGSQGPLFWISDPNDSGAQIPFADAFAFRDAETALTFIYYWAALIIFLPCIEQLHEAIFQPVLDAFPQVYPSLPPSQQVNPLRYGAAKVREMAASVCRSLDSALMSTTQPDMLAVPLYIVEEHYREINASSAGDGALELMWCEAFRARLAARGQDIANIVCSRQWFDLAQY